MLRLVVGLDVHGEIPLATEGFVAYVACVGSVGVTFLLVDGQVILSSKFHATSSTHELSVLGLVALLDVSPQSEPGVENLLAEVTLEVDIELTVCLVFVFDTGVHVSERVVTHVTGESSQQVVGGVVVSDGLVVLLELPLTMKGVEGF